MSSDKKSTHSEVGDMHSPVKRIEVIDRILHDLMGVGYGKGSPQNMLIFECTVEIIQYLENQLLTPTKPVEITEEEIDQMFPLEVDKVMFKASKSYNQMQKHRREGAKAILTKLNGER